MAIPKPPAKHHGQPPRSFNVRIYVGLDTRTSYDVNVSSYDYESALQAALSLSSPPSPTAHARVKPIQEDDDICVWFELKDDGWQKK